MYINVNDQSPTPQEKISRTAFLDTSSASSKEGSVSVPVWFILSAGLLTFSPLLDGGTTHVALVVIRLFVLSLFGWYVIEGIIKGQLEYRFPRGSYLIGLYLLVGAINTWYSPYTHQSLQWLIVLMSYAILLYLFVFFVTEWDHCHKFLLFVVGLCLLEAIWAIVQWWLGSLRPSGTFFNPNFLAGYVVVGWMIVLAGLCYLPVMWGGKQDRMLQGLAKISTYVIILGLLLSAVVVTGSRAGLVGLVVGSGVILLMRFGLKGIVMAAPFILVAVLVPNPLRDRVLSEHTYNPITYARWNMWKSTVQQIKDYPFGVGLGLYQYTFPRYSFPIEGQVARYTMVAKTPHNEYLHMGAEMGIASVVLFMCGIIAVVREARWILSQRLRRWQRGLMVGTIGGMATLLVHAALDSNLHEPALAILLILCASIILSGRKLLSSPLSPSYRVSIQPRWLWGGLAVLAGIIIAGSLVRLGLASSYSERGDLAAAQHNYSSAIELYQGAVALDPSKAMYHTALAGTLHTIYSRAGNLEAALFAIEELQAARRLNPLDGRIPGELGRVFVAVASSIQSSDVRHARSDEERTQWLQRAETAFREALVSEPFTAAYWFELGQVQAALGQNVLAISTVHKALEIEPNFLPAREWLARLYLGEGRREEALHEYLEIVERQRQFSSRPQDLIAQRFLKADAAGLWKVLEQMRFGI